MTRCVEQFDPPRAVVLRNSAQSYQSRRTYGSLEPHPGFAHGLGHHTAALVTLEKLGFAEAYACGVNERMR